MTYSVYNVTSHTQLSIRGTTGTHPDSKFVLGIHIDSDDGVNMVMPNFSAYDDMDWDEAVRMAKWILEQNEWIERAKKNDRGTE